MNPTTIGKSIESAGGGIIGAVAFLLVGIGIGVAYVVWKAYQQKVNEDKDEDKRRIEKLENEVSDLRKEGKEREEKLIGLVADGQKIQVQTNTILKEIKIEQKEIRTQLAYLQGSVNSLAKKE